MECRLTYSPEPWHCQVYLRIEKDEYGVESQSKMKEHKSGAVLFDKSKLEPMLRRAQLAILNPSVPFSKFVDFELTLLSPGEAPAGSSRQLQFSANVVCLDLSGPAVPDLSFIDLPGSFVSILMLDGC